MSSLKAVHRGLLDMNVANNQFVVPTEGGVSFTARVIPLSSWGTAVVTFERSLDRLTWGALESATTATTAAPATAEVACDSFPYLRARVSTAEGSALHALIDISVNTEV